MRFSFATLIDILIYVRKFCYFASKKYLERKYSIQWWEYFHFPDFENDAQSRAVGSLKPTYVWVSPRLETRGSGFEYRYYHRPIV